MVDSTETMGNGLFFMHNRVRKHPPKQNAAITKLMAVLFICVALVLAYLFREDLAFTDTLSDETPYINEQLLDLPPNRWVKIHQPFIESWRRQTHAGAAFDLKRGKLLVFGSDTHGENWDNSVHEFDPVIMRWSTHYPAAVPKSYRINSQGYPAAGEKQLLPWAMHSFDSVVYDPNLDALIVTALPEHNPASKNITGTKIDPTWIYELGPRQWRVFPNDGNPTPRFFAAASAYDKSRDVIVAYNNGIWELGPDRKRWHQATKETHHEIHFNMVYDSKHRKLAVFGDHRNTNAVWLYTPGEEAGDKGVWEKMIPGGDPCPEDQHFPVAFDDDNGVFLLVPDNRPTSGQGKAQSSSTYVYDLSENAYLKLPNADLKPLGMNYMMVYDPSYKVFLLVTGDWTEPATVWALRLDLLREKRTVR